MGVSFNPNTGILVDEGTTVRQNVANNWKKAFKIDDNSPDLNTEPETPAGQLVDGMTALIIQKDNEILQLSNMFNPETAVGIYQDALGKIYFIERHIAQPTVVTCTCKGLQGTQIPAGAIVQSTSGNQLVSNGAATIGESGTVDIQFSCVDTGAIIINAETVNKIITVVPGWDSVINNNAGVVGREAETQAEFEERRFDSVAKNSHGLAESVGGSVNNLESVIACRIEQNRTDSIITVLGVQIPPHSIYLSVYGGTPEEIGAIIHNKLDAGCGTAGNTSVQITDQTNFTEETYFYTAAIETNLFVKISTNEDALYDETTIKTAVIANLSGNNNYNRLKMGDTLFASRFYQTVISAGLADLVDIQVSKDGNEFMSKISFNLNEMPVLSADNISFSEVTL